MTIVMFSWFHMEMDSHLRYGERKKLAGDEKGCYAPFTRAGENVTSALLFRVGPESNEVAPVLKCYLVDITLGNGLLQGQHVAHSGMSDNMPRIVGI